MVDTNISKAEVKGLVAGIRGKFEGFIEDAKKTGNKAAARRARKATLELSDLMKQFRKISIK